MNNFINIRYHRLSIFSQLSILQFMGLCVFSLPISHVMIGRIYILCLVIIIKSEVWTSIHCLGSGHETMVCTVCLAIFLSCLADCSFRIILAEYDIIRVIQMRFVCTSDINIQKKACKIVAWLNLSLYAGTIILLQCCKKICSNIWICIMSIWSHKCLNSPKPQLLCNQLERKRTVTIVNRSAEYLNHCN